VKKPFLLVAEDEASIQRLVCENLEAEGYRTAAVDHGEAALRAAQDVDMDLILLDVMLPGMDGFEVCRRLRKLGNRTPILFLTARDLPRDRVEGLQAGGDDYLVKPFHLDELLARIAALLRRVGWEQQPITGQIALGEGWVDLQTRDYCDHQGNTEILSPKEFGILKLLWDANGRIVSRGEILRKVWGNEADPTPRTIDNFVVRLRRHFEKNPAEPRIFLTIRGVGYRLELNSR